MEGDTVSRLKQLCYLFVYYYTRRVNTNTGALCQVWCPDANDELSTRGRPYNIMGVSDDLVLYRNLASRHTPPCNGSDATCPISTVFAGLQPQLTPDNSPSSMKGTGFVRQLAVQHCNIRSGLVLPVYDLHLANDSAPVAVFELAQHQATLNLATVIDCLNTGAQGCDFYIPPVEAADAVEECDVQCELPPPDTSSNSAMDGRPSSSSSSGPSRQAANRPAGSRRKALRRSSCLIVSATPSEGHVRGNDSQRFDGVTAAIAATTPGPAPAATAAGRGGGMSSFRRRSVIVMDTCVSETARQPPAQLQPPAEWLSLGATDKSCPSQASGGLADKVLAALAVSRAAQELHQQLEQQQAGAEASAVCGWDVCLDPVVDDVAARACGTSHTLGSSWQQQQQQGSSAGQQRQHAVPWPLDRHSCGDAFYRQQDVNGSLGQQGRKRCPSADGQQQPQAHRQPARAPDSTISPASSSAAEVDMELNLQQLCLQGSGHGGVEQPLSSANPFVQPQWRSPALLRCSPVSQASLQPVGQQQLQLQSQRQQQLQGMGLLQQPSSTSSIARTATGSGVLSSSSSAVPGSSSESVRALVGIGGTFRPRGFGGACEFVGGMQRLVVVSRYSNMQQLRGQLCNLSGMCSRQVAVKYALPGASSRPTYIDLSTDDDVQLMWEEWDEYTVSQRQGGDKLQLFVGYNSMTTTSSRPSSSNSSRRNSSNCDAQSLLNALSIHSQPSTPTAAPAGPQPLSGSSSAVDAAAWAGTPAATASGPVLTGTAHEAAAAAAVVAARMASSGLSPAQSASVPMPSFGCLLGAQSSAGGPGAAEGWHDLAAGASAGAADTAYGLIHIQQPDSVGSEGGSGDHDQLFVTATENLLMSAAVVSTAAANSMSGAGAAQAASECAAESSRHLGSFCMPVRSMSGAQHGASSTAAVPAEPGAAADGGRTGANEQQQQQQRAQPRMHELVSDLQVKVEVLQPEQLQVVRLLGGGAFGEVYLARWHGTEVAVKCLSPSLLVSRGSSGPTSRAVTELLQEASMLASLRHPNIVSCFGVVLPPPEMLDNEASAATAADNITSSSGTSGQGGASGGAGHPSAPAIVTEYMSVGSLRSAISKRAEWLNSNMAKVKMLLDAARGLDYLHAKHLVHFDLKSDNLLVTVRDKVPCVKIADMGLTKARSQTFVTGIDSLRGTLPWIAPEVLKDPQCVRESADIYSFGVIMWELWTGGEPFEGVPLHALLHQLMSPTGLSLPLPGTADWQELGSPPEPVPGWSDLMQHCWQPATQRPTARQLVSLLDGLMGRLKEMRRNKSKADGPAQG